MNLALRLASFLVPFPLAFPQRLQRQASEENKQGRAPVAEHNEDGHTSSMWHRMQQATGTVYGDIGTSVLYCVMEITRETILIKNHHLGHESKRATW